MKDDWDKYIELFNKYLKAERNASMYTIRDYQHSLTEFKDLARLKGIDSPAKVEKQTVREYMAKLNNLGRAHSTIGNKLSAIRSFYRYLMREEIISKNPAGTIASPKLDRRLPTFLTLDEAKHLIESPSLPERPISTSKSVLQRNITILELLYASGLRVSELVNMNVEEVNLATNEIRVRGKGSKERVVLIGIPAARALNAYIIEGRREFLGEKKNNALFVNYLGERLLVRTVQKILEKYARTINKKVHPHILRHTFATHLLDGGADLKVVQELLGHADLSSTQIYTHVTQSRARKIYLSAHPMARKDSDKHE
jgi:integrase/recombinase XerC